MNLFFNNKNILELQLSFQLYAVILSSYSDFLFGRKNSAYEERRGTKKSQNTKKLNERQKSAFSTITLLGSES